MKIMYIHQYFASRQGLTGTRSYEFGRYLVSRGHEVTFIISGLANTEFPADPEKTVSIYKLDGMHIHSVAGGYNNPHVGTATNGWSRMHKFYEFAWMASRAGKNVDAPDVVFATHTPLTVGLSGLKLSRFFSVPLVFEVRDLWPEALINVGALTNPLGVWWLRRMARKIYQKADHIVALSPGMKKCIEQYGITTEKVTVISNASDLDLFHPGIDGRLSRERLGLGKRFAAIYFGAMGMANGLEYVIEAARILAYRGRDDIILVLHGAGGRRYELEKLSRSYGLTNVVFSPLVPDKEEVARIVAGCDVCMTIYNASKEQTWSPNKMFDALAAGKPILINVSGWLGETVEQSRCGRYVDPQRPEALADALGELSQNPGLCRQMGENARALAERQFDRRILAARLEDVLTGVVARHGKGGK